MTKKLLWNNKGLELLSKEHRLIFPPAPSPLNPKRMIVDPIKLSCPLIKNLICVPPLQDTSVYPPNMYSFTLTIVTVGPLPSQLLWNVDAAQPSVLACQHLTKSVRDAVGRTGSKNEISFPKYLLGFRPLSIMDALRPSVCVKETRM